MARSEGPEPNDRQSDLIEGIEGIYLVDAGAGTGKTLSITRRYANVLRERDVDPEDLLLVTFTNNAAEEMKKKVLDLCEGYSPSELREAPISTFHSLCNSLVKEHGFDSPRHLGIDDSVTSSTEIIENSILEEQEFRRFMNRFIDDHPEFRDYYRVIFDFTNLLDLIKKLASRGVFPTREGWYQNGESYLEGDYERFEELFEDANESDGSRQSDLRGRLSGYGKNCLPPEAPGAEEVRGGRGCKQVPEEIAERAFHGDREDLKEFVHDVYLGYIEYALDRNYLNFNFLLMFAYVLLCEDDGLRRDKSYEYVMIDEFQDTSEIQLKLALLLAGKPNICAVGDWKQSIYSFQYADVDNIREFEERLERFKRELNMDRTRVGYDASGVEEIPLEENYRSTQEILDFSEQSLALKATKRESIDPEEALEDVTSLGSCDALEGPTEIAAIQSEDEEEAILEKIQEVVGNRDYLIGDADELEEPSYGDVVVLTRTSKFGLELQRKAREYGIPLVYEGGTEIFRTDPGIMLLAWLRVVDYEHSRRGWAVILEQAGYNLDEVDQILKDRDYPEEMLGFRGDLEGSEYITSAARKVFDRYGFDDAFADRIIEVLRRTYRGSYMNLGRIIQFIEENIEAGTSYDVDNTRRGDVVKVRTIHSEKGLQEPIVFISDVNTGRFPSVGRGGGRIDFREPIGLRQKKVYREDGVPYVYDNWRSELLGKCLSGRYDEERRLMYVAMTRAERYLFFTATEDRASPFFENLDIEAVEVEPELEEVEGGAGVPEGVEVGVPSRKTPLKRSVHDLVELEEGGGRGREYGSKVHFFAQRYAEGEDVVPGDRDEENVGEFLDGLGGRLLTEVPCFLPLEAGGRRMVLEGAIDLVHVEGESVEAIDYKTDLDRRNEEGYVKQLSAYYHVLESAFEGKEVSCRIFYTESGELVEIEPLGEEELRAEL